MEKGIVRQLHGDFEKSVQKEEETGLEFWLVRDLQKLLDYDEWRNFLKVIDKAKTACLNSGQNVSYHFVDVNKMIDLGKGAVREVEDIALTDTEDEYAAILMKLQFVANQEYQLDAIKATVDLFAGQLVGVSDFAFDKAARVGGRWIVAPNRV